MKVLIAVALLTGLLACHVTEGIVQHGESPVGDVLPGAEPFTAALNDSLRSTWVTRPAEYVPRTQHIRDDRTPLFVNRLFLESSPYLRQHAHNPVNWFPWGNEAFELAVSLGRPVFLSIGYSTCHWCHVMEEESFDDIEIARYLNEHYVAIKVDRELRPDLDSIYMSAVQLFTRGNGGWPMTLWLTPQGQPYSGGSYFPARDGDRGVSAGLLTLLKQLKEAYDDQPDRVVAVAAQVVDEIRTRLNPGLSGTEVLDDSSIQKAASNYHAEFDSTFGGIRGPQKFPASLPLRFLLRYHRRTGDLDFLNMVTTTLERITAGGIHDHVGGGFHRYATDERWLVPHFEKMLYDNALLTLAYLEAYQATGREDFADVVHSTLSYVDREMSAPNGGFYSATDADSLSPRGIREEGWFFTWTPEEIESAVGPERAHIINAYFGVTASGHLGERSVLHRPSGDLEFARKLGISLDYLRITVNEAREMLYEVRRQRPAPLRDEKIVTAWNGLMISAFARASHVLSTGDYAARARRAATFLIEQAKVDDRLVRSPTVGAVNGFGYLDDYAFMVSGLLDLFEVTGETRWFREALLLDMVLERDFEDQVEGGFFRAPIDADLLLTREKPHYDSAEPSGNAVHLLNLIRLHDFTADDRYRRRAESAFAVFQPTLTHFPTAASEMLLALDYSLDTPKAVIIVVPTSRSEAEPFLTRLSSTFLPNRILVVAVEGSDLEEQASLVPILVGKYAMRGMATAYVCENRVCDLPTTDPEVFSRQIQDDK